MESTIMAKIELNGIMIDLETTGINPGCAILSIGAVQMFTDTLDGSEEFYGKIDVTSCHAVGLFDEPSSVAWWSRQPQDVRDEAYSGTLPIKDVLTMFSLWYKWRGDDLLAWGNGADFDLPILTAAYAACDMEVPWKPYNGRCYRTLKSFFPEIRIRPRPADMMHNALLDARYQAGHCELLLEHFKEIAG
jgi:DNA polymerase III epsilon subunit-like protein